MNFFKNLAANFPLKLLNGDNIIHHNINLWKLYVVIMKMCRKHHRHILYLHI